MKELALFGAIATACTLLMVFAVWNDSLIGALVVLVLTAIGLTVRSATEERRE